MSVNAGSGCWPKSEYVSEDDSTVGKVIPVAVLSDSGFCTTSDIGRWAKCHDTSN